jgi:drug/metabolite transporter (DMT)-like permease
LITAVVSAALILGKVLAPAEMIGGVLILAAALIEALRSNSDPMSLLPKGEGQDEGKR